MTHTQAAEDYLMAIFHLQRRAERVSTTLLAEYVDVAPASVTSMLKKLAGAEWVIYTPYQGVTLTASGESLALDVLRRHRLVESFLSEVLALPWDQLHAEAHRWEHVISDTVLERMNALLGYPLRDPHGAPIPQPDGGLPAYFSQTLADLPPGQPALVAQVDDHIAALLRHLSELGLCPDAPIEVLAVAPFDGPLTVKVGDKEQIVGRNVAQHVYVSIVDNN